jgi:MFS family permease
MSTQAKTQTKTEERVYEKPVAWLLGRQLVASLKSTLLYTAYGPKLEARDWMVANVFPSDDQAEADAFWKKNDEFWFDYIADSGDGMMATYSIAYLCLSELRLKPPGSDAPLDLPRGEFLFVGGDTTYHLADYATLHNRFHTPFIWAHQDLLSLGLVDEVRRPIFGIPGNHDYYDMLDGFRRQFRQPFPSRPDDKVYPPGVFGPQLRIPGFERYQETSYVALRLPFEWMIWGLDTEVGKIDERQRDFFKSVNDGKIPNKLIVATSAPTTVFGEFADRDDEKCAKAFFQLGLPRPFLPDEKLEDSEKHLKVNSDQIRLDLSGDVHQYARYWGPAPVPDQNPRSGAKTNAINKPNYASVVSGLGGAFHHPSTTYVDEVKEQVLYPPENISRSAVTDQLFSVIEVARGGNVWLIGAILAATLAFAAIASESSRPAINNFGVFTMLHITQPEPYESLTQMQQKITQESIWGKLGIVAADWVPKLPQKAGCENEPMYLWGNCRIEWPSEYIWGLFILFLTIIPIGAALTLTSRYYAFSETQQDVKEGALKAHAEEEEPKPDENQKIVDKVNYTLWSTTLITILLVVAGLLAILPYRAFITPFGNSLLVLATMVWAGVAVYLSIRYSDWLFQQAAKRKIRWTDWIITWVHSIAAAGSVAIGLWVLGKYSLPAYLVSDIIFLALLLATLILLPLLAITLGGAHQKPLGKVGMGLIGLWHWLLQLGVALFLIMKGTWLTVVLSVLVFLTLKWIGKQLMRANRRWWLLASWLEFGAIMLALPPVVYGFLLNYHQHFSETLLKFVFYPHTFDPSKPFASYEWWFSYGGWWQVFPLALAAIFGGVLSCMWLGWYFGVCLGFNGHNNEVGGASRIEKFKQFIRIRLTANDLTAYVIAIDQPEKPGQNLDAKIIDVFRLHAKRP